MKIGGKRDGDQMQITKRRLRQIIKEEVERIENTSNENSTLIQEIVSIIQTYKKNELTQLHEILKRKK